MGMASKDTSEVWLNKLSGGEKEIFNKNDFTDCLLTKIPTHKSARMADLKDGAGGVRTRGLLTASQTRSQLRHSPEFNYNSVWYNWTPVRKSQEKDLE